MDWLKRMLRTRYVGTVYAESIAVDHEGVHVKGSGRIEAWVLTESLFGRKAERVGRCDSSPMAMKVRGQVRAWQRGGPLPEGVDKGAVKKKAPVLELLPGGKGDG